RQFKSILLEAIAVGITAIALAFLANAISPRGVKLSRDYFPGAAVVVNTPIEATASYTAQDSNHLAAAPDAAVAARLQANGLRLVHLKEVLELFHDQRYSAGTIVFVDSRNDEHYQAGHIPGA